MGKNAYKGTKREQECSKRNERKLHQKNLKVKPEILLSDFEDGRFDLSLSVEKQTLQCIENSLLAQCGHNWVMTQDVLKNVHGKIRNILNEKMKIKNVASCLRKYFKLLILCKKYWKYRFKKVN